MSLVVSCYYNNVLLHYYGYSAVELVCSCYHVTMPLYYYTVMLIPCYISPRILFIRESARAFYRVVREICEICVK